MSNQASNLPGKSPSRPKSRRLRGALVAALLGSTMLAIPVLAPSIVPTAPFAFAGTHDAGLLENNAPFSFANLVEQVSPAVVSIRVESGVEQVSTRDDERGNDNQHGEDQRDQNRGDDNRGDDSRGRGKGSPSQQQSDRGGSFNDLFRRFFDDNEEGRRQFRDPRDRGQQPRSASQGSGFVISADGYVVTNNHVIEDATKIEISFDDGSKHEARLIGTDSRTDLALLKIDSDKTFEFVEFAVADVRIGDWVVAVGNPFGLGGTVTAGIVSARGRDLGSGPYDDYLQIDASINRGNSGGPAFNLNGRVIGVNTAIYSPTGGSVGIGFAIPSSVVQEVVGELRQDGIVTRGWLGVGIQNLTDDIAESLGLGSTKGSIVTSVADNSPAQEAGVEEGDTILTVNGNAIEDSKDLARRVASLEPEDDAILGILREGEEREITVTLGSLESPPEDSANNNMRGDKNDTEQGSKLDRMGMQLEESPDQEGVVIVEIDADSEAFDKGLRQGDIIIEVGGVQVSQLSDVIEGLRSAEEQSRKSVLLQVRSGDQQRFVALPVGRG
jgi:serine protease Do